MDCTATEETTTLKIAHNTKKSLGTSSENPSIENSAV